MSIIERQTLEAQKQKLQETIQDACNEYRNAPDWAKNMEVIDFLNRNTYLCPYAVQEIRRQLKTKNPEIEILALTLTEGIIKNCPTAHASIAHPDFMRYLVKVALNQRADGFWKSAGKKMRFKKDHTINKEHMRAQTIDKALLILRMLNDGYKNTKAYPIFKTTYKDLVKQGVRFPKPTKDEDITIFSPIHSTAKQTKEEISAMGSIPPSQMPEYFNTHLPMVRPVQPIENVKSKIVQTALDNGLLLFDMMNAPNSDLGGEIIGQLLGAVNACGQNVQAIASNPDAYDPVDVVQAFQVNETLMNLLQDYEGLVTGTKRRFVHETKIDVAAMASEEERERHAQRDAMDDKSDDDEPRIDESVSLDVALEPPAPSKRSTLSRIEPAPKEVNLLDMTSEEVAPPVQPKPHPAQPQPSQPSQAASSDLLSFMEEIPKASAPSAPVGNFDPLSGMSSPHAQPQVPQVQPRPAPFVQPQAQPQPQPQPQVVQPFPQPYSQPVAAQPMQPVQPVRPVQAVQPLPAQPEPIPQPFTAPQDAPPAYTSVQPSAGPIVSNIVMDTAGPQDAFMAAMGDYDPFADMGDTSTAPSGEMQQTSQPFAPSKPQPAFSQAQPMQSGVQPAYAMPHPVVSNPQPIQQMFQPVQSPPQQPNRPQGQVPLQTQAQPQAPPQPQPPPPRAQGPPQAHRQPHPQPAAPSGDPLLDMFSSGPLQSQTAAPPSQPSQPSQPSSQPKKDALGLDHNPFAGSVEDVSTGDNPFDMLDDPFSAMPEEQPSKASDNPFDLLNTGDTAGDFDLGDHNPFDDM